MVVHLYSSESNNSTDKRNGNEVPGKLRLNTENALPEDATFKASWSIPSLAGRFDHLKDFAGGLARPFPHIATVESDFSIDGARGQLEHYSLEGIMQCKEHERLKSVSYGKN